MTARATAGLLLGALLFAACQTNGGVAAPNGTAGTAGSAPTVSAAAMRPALTADEIRDPKKCMNCHPNHYREWASSMHAYSSKDPVFLAMNKRGQRETNGQLGDFCLKCHAPMAVLENKLSSPTQDLTTLPDAYQGVTCFYCHNADSVDSDHNATLHLTNDTTLRGPIRNPKQPGVHVAAYASLLDGDQLASSGLCGGCHDIVTPSGVHLERTFEEYKESIFSKGVAAGSCSGCHMDGHSNQLAADDPLSQVGVRTVHEHLWPGVDVALTDDFPDRDAQELAVQCNLSRGALTFSFQLMSPLGDFAVTLETQAGHRQPSGASQDRRMWFEMLAYDSTGAQLSTSSGAIAEGEIEEKASTDPAYDPQLWMFHDRLFDGTGQRTDNFWDAAPSAQYPDGYEMPLTTLPAQISTDASVPHYASKTFHEVPPGSQPGATARVVGHLRMRPIGMDVLQDLVASGDLDPSIPAKMKTFTMAGTEVEWTPDLGYAPITPTQDSLNCPNSYLCLLQPGSVYCNSGN